ncbi:Hpt domain protein [Verrucomicrobiia bacterium DG1235]|nr:Hpt domain protein [Verrucomicrobiae bacterium DG1235]
MSELSYKAHKFFIPETLLSRLMDDEDLMKEVLDACLPDLNDNVKLFSQQLEDGLYKEATRTIHTIKGSAQNSDLKALSLLSLEIEDALYSGLVDKARSLRPDLDEVVGNSIQAVERYFAERS